MLSMLNFIIVTKTNLEFCNYYLTPKQFCNIISLFPSKGGFDMQKTFTWRRSLALFSVLVLLLTMIPLAALATTGTINTKSVNLRTSATKKSKALSTLNKGDTLTILETHGDWYKVSYGKYTGYVMKQYVTVNKSSGGKATSGSSTGGAVTSTSATVKSKVGSAPGAMKKGASGGDVKKLQQALQLVGCYSGSIDGSYGNGTRDAVKKFQKSAGLSQSGNADSKTIAALWGAKIKNSGSSGKVQTERLNWFKNGSGVIPKGATFSVKDCKTGKTFKVKRWSGGNHADCEPLTASDTSIIKGIYGGISWKRRAILVKYNGHVYAASMNFYPHGTQTITNNKFEGHFCIHFYGSKTHGTAKVDAEHKNCEATAMNYTW